jgi:GT2 family glycosyltransferase
VLPGAFDAMVRYMDAHSDVGALGPRLLSEDRSCSYRHAISRLDHDVVVLLEVKHWLVLGDLARRYAQRAFEADYLETHQVDWVQGSCLMLRREAIEQVGVLDENYFLTMKSRTCAIGYGSAGGRQYFCRR